MENQARYTKHGMMISVLLPKPNNEYEVYAMIKKVGDSTEKTFDVTFYLYREDIGRMDLVDDNVYRFESELVYTDVMNFILSHYEGGFFNKSIERYEYELEMCCIGIDVTESKS